MKKLRWLLAPLLALGLVAVVALPAQAANNPSGAVIYHSYSCKTYNFSHNSVRTHTITVGYQINNPSTGQYQDQFYPRYLDVTIDSGGSDDSEWTEYQQTWYDQQGGTTDLVGAVRTVGEPPHSSFASFVFDTSLYYDSWGVSFWDDSIGPNGSRGSRIPLDTCYIHFSRTGTVINP